MKLMIACFAFIACLSVKAQGKYKLVWEEDFNGKKLDTSHWNYEVNDEGGGNHELQYYTARDTNCYVKGGLLHIRGLKEDYLTRHYTSARIDTRHKADFLYGKMEIRAKIPTGRGTWPAIWMMPTDDKYGDWPKSGEIDIMETKGQYPDTLYGTGHFGPLPPHNLYRGKLTEHEVPNGYGDDFHVYGIEWKKDTIDWYVDGRQYFELTKTYVSSVTTETYPFNEKFHFILNMAIGGEFVGDPDPKIFPKEFLVDYIKVYQKK